MQDFFGRVGNCSPLPLPSPFCSCPALPGHPVTVPRVAAAQCRHFGALSLFSEAFFVPAVGVPGLMTDAPSMDGSGTPPARPSPSHRAGSLSTAAPARSARRDRGQTVKAAQVGLF